MSACNIRVLRAALDARCLPLSSQFRFPLGASTSVLLINRKENIALFLRRMHLILKLGQIGVRGTRLSRVIPLLLLLLLKLAAPQKAAPAKSSPIMAAMKTELSRSFAPRMPVIMTMSPLLSLERATESLRIDPYAIARRPQPKEAK